MIIKISGAKSKTTWLGRAARRRARPVSCHCAANALGATLVARPVRMRRKRRLLVRLSDSRFVLTERLEPSRNPSREANAKEEAS